MSALRCLHRCGGPALVAPASRRGGGPGGPALCMPVRLLTWGCCPSPLLCTCPKCLLCLPLPPPNLPCPPPDETKTKMDVAKEVLGGIVDQLAPQDSLSIVLFRWGAGKVESVQLGLRAARRAAAAQRSRSRASAPARPRRPAAFAAATARACPRRWDP